MSSELLRPSRRRLLLLLLLVHVAAGWGRRRQEVQVEEQEEEEEEEMNSLLNLLASSFPSTNSFHSSRLASAVPANPVKMSLVPACRLFEPH